MQRLHRPLLILALVAVVIWASYRWDVGAWMSVDGMRALVERHEPYGPLIFIGACIAGIFLHMPEIIFIALGGVLFGKLQGFVYGWIAAVIGTTGTFLLVRHVAGDWVQKAVHGRFARLRALDHRLAEHGFRTIILLRLMLFLSPPLNWVIGATRVRVQDYIAGTAIGIVPGIATTVFFADSIAQSGSVGGALTPEVVVPALLVLAVLTTGGVAARRYLRG